VSELYNYFIVQEGFVEETYTGVFGESVVYQTVLYPTRPGVRFIEQVG
jgi:hypothetical protein